MPFAFLLSALLPWAVTVILVLGAIYLAYEGAEKIYEYFVPHEHKKVEDLKKELDKAGILAVEKSKIKSAIITDFILSVEIVIIALGTVVGQNLLFQILVVSIVAIIATVGVYGIVALIVRMDDFGYKLISLSKNGNGFWVFIGNLFVNALPKIIKSLSVIGTIALLLVAGGIFVHNIEFLHHFLEILPSILRDFIVGLIVGVVALIFVMAFKRITKIFKN